MPGSQETCLRPAKHIRPRGKGWLIMHRRPLGALTGSLLILLSVVAAASAAPARVTVRAEGATQTRVPLTSLTTTSTHVVKDGNAQHSCSGTSVAGALQQATKGNWNGTWYDGLGYSVDTIGGETYKYPNASYWTLWVNNKFSQTGACQTELQTGDAVLLFVDRCDGADASNNFTCQNAPVLPLGVLAPRQVDRGKPFTVTVVHYTQDGTAVREAGATVSAGGATTATGADGTASVTAPRSGDKVTVSATKAGRVRSGPETVCLSGGADGTCGTQDRIRPSVQIHRIANGQRFQAGRGPRLLHGTARDASGIRNVAFRLQRRFHGRCYAYDGRRERFARRGCRWGSPPFFSIGDRQNWSYLLPGRLPAGRYVLDVAARDKAGNLSGLKPGASRVVFTVAAKR